MPILDNPRYERFAQGLAAGKTADEAYTEAGYRPNRGNASTLKANQSIEARVAELQARVSNGIVLTKQWVIERLVENANRAMQAEEVAGNDGTGTGEYRYEGSVANRALELLGKELGMFVDKHEIDQTTKVISDKPLTADEWEQRYAADLGAPAGTTESLN